MKTLLRILTIVLLMSCCTIKPVPVEPFDTAQCPAACNHLRALGCPEGNTIGGIITCEDFCIETQHNGHSLNPKCIQTISTCAELNTKCGQ